MSEPLQDHVRTAPSANDGGTVVRTTTEKQIIPVPAGKDRTTPEFWEYLESLKEPDWGDHLLYVYREDPGPRMQVAKFSISSAAAEGIQWTDREEAEAAFGNKFGGRTFRIIVKHRNERVTEGRLYIPFPPKQLMPAPQENPGGPMITPMNESQSTADVAKTAISTIAGQEKQAFDVANQVLQSAASVVQRMSKEGGQPSETDLLMRQAMVAILNRSLNPPDPMESLAKLLAVMRELNTASNPAAAVNPMVQKILDTTFERFLHQSQGPPNSNASAELVRQLPNVAQYITQGIHEWRLGMEVQRDAIRESRGMQPPPGAARPGAPNPQVLPPVPPGGAQPPSGSAPAMNLPPPEFIEAKIVEILSEPLSSDEAAEEAFGFLDRMSPVIVKQLRDLGEQGLTNLFQSRPILSQATHNMPRLLEFIKAFLKYSGGDGEPQATAPPSNPKVN